MAIPTSTIPLAIHESPAIRCFRLIHDETRIIAYFESAGVTRTPAMLFCGTQTECQAEMTRLGFPVVAAPYHALPDAPPVAISKLSLRRKLRELGLEDAMDSFIAADAQRQRDYNDAQYLSLTDPLLAASFPLFATAAGKTEAEINALLLECRA